VQVDPIKHTVKGPGTKRLKLGYDGLLSNFGFKFNLRRYKQGGVKGALKGNERCTGRSDIVRLRIDAFAAEVGVPMQAGSSYT